MSLPNRYLPIQLALRSRLLSLVVATTGSTTLSATTTGYARTTGSFADDGFAPGMELTPSGFPQTTLGVITAVTALALTIEGGRTPAIAASGRSLVVGLPALVAWENLEAARVVGRPFLEEAFNPGAAFAPEVGTDARTETRVIYSPRINVRQNTDIAASGRYADAILAHFDKGTVITCGDGRQLCVMSSPAPSIGQRLPSPVPGWSVVPVNIPLYTLN